MKKLLLLAGIAAVGFSAVAAEMPEPKPLPGAYIYALSANGQWAVSQTMASLEIYNLATGQVDTYWNEGNASYNCGIGKCISDNGILVGSSDYTNAEYWKDGEWYTLDTPDEATSSCLSNAITPDGSRICGSIGVSDIVFDGDALMQVPVIWDAKGDGYGDPVLLPHPEFDFTGRVPQYITAVDISSDGKTVIGQIMNATGMMSYPIIYKEDANGEWSYEIPHADLLMPEGTVFPKYPGDGPRQPQIEEYMTPAEADAYQEAFKAWQDSNYTLPYPDPVDYVSEEGKAEYEAAMAVYNEEYTVWEEAFYGWYEVFNKCQEGAPGYEFNSIRISPDGNTYGCTIGKEDPNDPFAWGYSIFNVWVFDVNSDEITKYEQLNDFNLTYLADNGVAFACTSLYTASNSFVLKDGAFENMFAWMYSQVPAYASWMDQNMRFSYEDFSYDPETGDPVFELKEDVLMTGRAVSTPDLSTVALTVQNIWDFETEAEAVVFDVKGGLSGVGSIRPEVEGEKVIFDLSGRKLNNADAPGIYIINGEKKVVR